MKTKYSLIYLLFFIALVSCEQFLEVELPGQEPKLVVNALMEPSDTLKVFLTKSRGVLEARDSDDFDLVEGADVYLKDEEGQLFPMTYLKRGGPFETEAFYYLSGHLRIPSKTYEIIAEKEGFPSVNSQQKMVERINIKSIELKNLGINPDFDPEDIFEVILRFDDPPGSNFYEISGNTFGKDTLISGGDTTLFFYSSNLYPKPVNPIYEKDHLIRSVLLFNDNLLDGSDSEMVFRTSIRRNLDITVTLNFSHVSESFYLYYDTADLQWANRGDILSQPVLVFNNITNGLGIFKARNTDTRQIEIRIDD